MSTINNNTPINNIQNDNNNNKSNVVSEVKSLFFKRFKSIKSFVLEKTYVNSKKEFQLSKETQLHKIIPEHINLVENVTASKVQYLKHKPRVDDSGNVIENPEEKKFLLGKGSFGEVSIGALDSEDKTKNISPLFVKKKFIDRPSKNFSAIKEAKTEHYKNKKYGNDYSVIDIANREVISKYKGESFENLIKAAFDESDKYKNSKALSNEVKEGLCHQLLESVKQLHQRGVVHLDLKPANILVDAKGNLSIIDIAGAKQNSTKTQNYIEKHNVQSYTPIYAAPEIRDEQVTQAYDSWAVGAIIYELYTGKTLTENCMFKHEKREYFNELKIANVAKSAYLNNVKNNKNIPENINELISSLLVEKPSGRATMDQALYQLDRSRSKLDTLNDVELGVRHDKIFKKIVNLELQLKEAKEIEDVEGVVRIRNSIKIEKEALAPLQQQINQLSKK